MLGSEFALRLSFFGLYLGESLGKRACEVRLLPGICMFSFGRVRNARPQFCRGAAIWRIPRPRSSYNEYHENCELTRRLYVNFRLKAADTLPNSGSEVDNSWAKVQEFLPLGA